MDRVRLLLPALIAILLSLHSSNIAAEGGDIWHIDIEGAIGPATADHVIRGIEDAQEAGASLIILRIDTPGGLDAAMRLIIQEILASSIPVISWVGPKGSRAASAGTYIAYASHVSAMAPATNLGAATPVQIAAPTMPAAPGEPEEEPPSTEPTAMEKKMVNDAAAYIRGLAELRGRNAEWAELAVREGVSMNAEEAVANNVIDLVAENLAQLIDAVEGMTVEIDGTEVKITTGSGNVHYHEIDLRTEILSILTNPSMILVLGMLGIYGIILEFYNPGAMIPGVVGVICLLLAAYAVQLLPLNYAGLALLAVGIALMVAEAFMPSFGILGIGGVIAFCIGGLMLFDSEMEAFQVGIPTIAATAAVSALIIVASISIALKLRRQAVTTGKGVLIGQTGKAITDIPESGEGQVRIGAEIWRAASSGNEITQGSEICIDAVDGLLLTVSNKSNVTEQTASGET